MACRQAGGWAVQPSASGWHAVKLVAGQCDLVPQDGMPSSWWLGSAAWCLRMACRQAGGWAVRPGASRWHAVKLVAGQCGLVPQDGMPSSWWLGSAAWCLRMACDVRALSLAVRLLLGAQHPEPNPWMAAMNAID